MTHNIVIPAKILVMKASSFNDDTVITAVFGPEGLEEWGTVTFGEWFTIEVDLK